MVIHVLTYNVDDLAGNDDETLDLSAGQLACGLGMLAIPGVGPVVAAGWLAATAAGAVAGAVIALAIYIIVSRSISKSRANAIVEKAELEGENIKQQKILQAKERFLQLKSEHDQKVNQKNNELRERENNIKSREGQLNQQASELGKRQHDLDSQKGQVNAQKAQLEQKIAECDRLTAQVNKELENVAGMTAEVAKATLIENLKAQARSEAQAYINDTMDEARLNANNEAKKIIIQTFLLHISSCFHRQFPNSLMKLLSITT